MIKWNHHRSSIYKFNTHIYRWFLRNSPDKEKLWKYWLIMHAKQKTKKNLKKCKLAGIMKDKICACLKRFSKMNMKQAELERTSSQFRKMWVVSHNFNYSLLRLNKVYYHLLYLLRVYNMGHIHLKWTNKGRNYLMMKRCGSEMANLLDKRLTNTTWDLHWYKILCCFCFVLFHRLFLQVNYMEESYMCTYYHITCNDISLFRINKLTDNVGAIRIQRNSDVCIFYTDHRVRNISDRVI